MTQDLFNTGIYEQEEQESDDLKVVLNVRDYRYIDLLEQIKENAGINYQNLIKLGILFLFQEESRKVKQYQKELAAERQAPQSTTPAPQEKVAPPPAPGLKEQADDLLKVHITFVGKMRETIERWRAEKNITPHDVARLGLDKVYQFFTRDMETERTFKEETEPKKRYAISEDAKYEDTLSKYLEGKSGSLLNFLKS